jgi:hypothetical protein
VSSIPPIDLNFLNAEVSDQNGRSRSFSRSQNINGEVVEFMGLFADLGERPRIRTEKRVMSGDRLQGKRQKMIAS